MALNRKTFKKAAAVADTNLPSSYFNTVLYTGNGGTQRVGGYINRGAVTNTTPIDFSTENWSISWWIYLNTLSDSKQMIGKWGASPGVVFLFRTKSNGQIELYERDGTTNFLETTSAGTIAAGQWYNMTYSRSATEAKFYLNGSLNKTMSRTNAINQGGTEPINIGGNGSSGIDGKIDQVRIFNKAISSSEVTTLYEETHASTTKSTTDIFNDASGVALYQLDGNANDTGGASGYIGEGAIFNGSSSKITISEISATSISMWVNLDTLDRYDALLGHSTNSSNYVYWADSGESYQLRLGTLLFGSGTAKNTVGVVGSWVNVILVDNGSGTVTCYVDGSSAGSVSGSLPSFNEIGARTAGTDQWTKGKLDQVRIYDKALSSSEVTTLYGETASSNITISDLVAYYPMEGTSLDQEGS